MQRLCRIALNLGRNFLYIFADRKLGHVLNSRYDFALFEGLVNIVFLEEEVTSLKE
jgi:hypothetical protein